jgi:hypothetical protein
MRNPWPTFHPPADEDRPQLINGSSAARSVLDEIADQITIFVAQRTFAAAVQAAAEVQQSTGTLDQLRQRGARVFTARVPAWPSGVASRLCTM